MTARKKPLYFNSMAPKSCMTLKATDARALVCETATTMPRISEEISRPRDVCDTSTSSGGGIEAPR